MKPINTFLMALVTIPVYLWLRNRFKCSQPATRLPTEHQAAERNPAREEPTQFTKQRRGVHLCHINPPDEGEVEIETDIDIIAIHGLDTKSPDTWIWKGDPKDSKECGVNWLKDKNMLPSRVGRARIFTCDWPADLFETSDLIQNTIEEFARLLLAGIKGRHSTTSDRARREDRPILFIASCLGGIILIQALVMANNEYLSIKTATRGIIFLATPFRGTSFQDVASWAEPGLKAWASIRNQKVTKLLDSVKGSTFNLNELVRSFTQLHKDQDYKVSTFYETGYTDLYRKIPWLPIRRRKKQLVDQNSATLDIVSNPLPLKRIHVQMNKFSPDDEDYLSVVEKIKETLQEIREGTLLEKADRHSRDENTTSSPFSLFARLKIETPDEKMQVKLACLFDRREEPDGRVVQPRRILIRGRAGVGKTTLCKKIVHDFLQGTWKHLFDRILWVPLRRLKHWSPAIYGLKELFLHEFFANRVDRDLLANELLLELQCTEGKKTLFVLDGLDEIYQDLNNKSHRSDFLQYLLSRPNVIITSRPHVSLPAGVRAPDLELDTIGFYPDQVKEYLQVAFTNPKKAEEVHSFLQSHALIQGLVQIPIQLDALCYTWNDLDQKPSLQTMTAIYRAMEKKLWKKDILRLGKKHNGTLITKSDISNIDDHVQDEIHLLESLAFTGLYNNIIDFEPVHWEAVWEKFKSPSTRIWLNRTLPRLSFLRTSDPLSDHNSRNYHFLHLTYQEYFAARYFVRQWRAKQQLKCLELSNRKNKNIKPATFLWKHKYTARYDIVWRFTAGLLEPKEVPEFFDEIEANPLDLLGPTHQWLVMHCLSEVHSSTNLPIRQNLEEKLSKWLLFECDLTGSSLLEIESECPDQVLRIALETGFNNERKKILQLLQHSSRQLSDSFIEAIVILLQNEDGDVRGAAVNILGHQSNLSDRIVENIVTLLQNEDGYVREAAVDILGRQSGLSDYIVETIATLLQNEDGYVRGAAVNVLGHQSSLSDHIVESIATLLQNKDENVRGAAVNVLGHQSSLSDRIVETITTLLQHEDGNVKGAAVDALGHQSSLSDHIVETIATLLQNEDGYVRWAAVNILGLQSNLSDRIVETIATLLQDKDGYVREAAVNVLGHQSSLSDHTVETIATLLQDEDMYVRQAVINVLEHQSNLSDHTVEAIM